VPSVVSQLPSHEVIRSMPVLVGHDEPAGDAAKTRPRGRRTAPGPRDEEQGATIPMRINAVPRSWPMRTSPDRDDDDGDEERDDDVLEAAQQLPLAREDGRADEDEPELDQLGRLQLDAGQQADPVAVAVDRDAERR
jgi:hypothetical protein